MTRTLRLMRGVFLGVFLGAGLGLAAAPAGAQDAVKQPNIGGPVVDLEAEKNPTPETAFSAFQRGLYISARKQATILAEKGDMHAQTLLGLIYQNGVGVSRNQAEAIKWYSAAAIAGDPEAQFALGLILARGEGTPKDEAKAKGWFEAAAAQGHVEAHYNLALMYMEGDIVKRDFKKAAQLLGYGADREHPESLYNLAILYAEGQGVARNLELAAQLMGRAGRAAPGRGRDRIRLHDLPWRGREAGRGAGGLLARARRARWQRGGPVAAGQALCRGPRREDRFRLRRLLVLAGARARPHRSRAGGAAVVAHRTRAQGGQRTHGRLANRIRALRRDAFWRERRTHTC